MAQPIPVLTLSKADVCLMRPISRRSSAGAGGPNTAHLRFADRIEQSQNDRDGETL
ncbi:hypothetical protein QTA57_13165 [Fontisubflavum oceani]|uniref:hypothetical protein n=1 Tax=Fontisubflavum oceani TaxID=2978973 RepID=UPI0025B562B0|nr:hypothetical protein [Fontisubflavum oceani]WJY20764.1 hypothetical protein QTA57_13165 [Fontisubflavum oceani]